MGKHILSAVEHVIVTQEDYRKPARVVVICVSEDKESNLRSVFTIQGNVTSHRMEEPDWVEAQVGA